MTARLRLTPRQWEAIDWLTTVGKATSKLARKHGFQQRTLDALADKGLVQREYVSRVVGGPFPVYRPLSYMGIPIRIDPSVPPTRIEYLDSAGRLIGWSES